MRFEERELTSHAEPMAAAVLEQGMVYFFVNFLDDEMLIPELQPVVFIGKDLQPGDSDRIYFQDCDSYRRGVRFHDAEQSAKFFEGAAAETAHIFSYEKALEVLMRCSLRRQASSV